MKKLTIDKAPQKELEKVDAVMRRRIIDGITGLLQEPPRGDIKQLKGALHGLFRLRVGSWRITYEVTDEAVSVVQISPRGGAYRKEV